MSVKSFKFVSPGVFINEIDNSFIPRVAETIGPVVIGRAAYGPAMEPTQVQSFSEFINIYGDTVPGNGGGDVYRGGNRQSPMYGTYAAKAFLNANVAPLTYMRLLGHQHTDRDNTDAAKAGWKTIGHSKQVASGGGAFGLWVFPSSSVTFLSGTQLAPQVDSLSAHTGAVAILGTGSLAAIWYCTSGSAVVLSGSRLGLGAISSSSDKSGFAQGMHIDEFIKSKNVAENGAIIQSSATGRFTVRVVSDTTNKTDVDDMTREDEITFGFDDDSEDFIRDVFNTNPQLASTAGDFYPAASRKPYWLGESFEQHLRAGGGGVTTDLATEGTSLIGTGLYGVMLPIAKKGTKTDAPSNMLDKSATDGNTGWFIGQDLGTADKYTPEAATKLFRLIGRSQGEWLHKNLKVSIERIKASTSKSSDYGSFSVVLRMINDTDSQVQVVERFDNCNLDPSSPNYVGRKIGTVYAKWSDTDRRLSYYGDYPNMSKFVRVEVNEDVDNGATDPKLIPFGYHGPPTLGQIGTVSENWTGRIAAAGTTGKYVFTAGALTASATTLLSGSDSSLTDAFGISGSAILTWPADRLRHSASDGGLADPTNAYFGFHNRRQNSSTRPDSSVSDIHRMLTVDLGTNPSDASGVTGSSYVFSLDDIQRSAAGGPYYYASGSRKSEKSVSATNDYKTLLDAGYDRFTAPFFGGFDGLDILLPDPFYNAGMTGASLSERSNSKYYTIKRAIDTLADPEFVDINLMSMPGLTQEGLTTHMINVCEERADALAVIDLPGVYTPTHESYQADRSNRVGGNPTGVANTLRNRRIDSSYGCTFYPWVQTRDQATGQLLWIPPSVAMLGTFASSQAASQLWFAPAGFNRGGLTDGAAGLPIVNVSERLVSKDRDTLYENNINPIASFPSSGIVVFGQKTLQDRQSALDRINVRRLVIFMKKQISILSTRVLFEQNVPATWNRFKSLVEPFLANVQTDFGITDYKLILDETTTTPDLVDQNILYAKIMIKPARAIEYIAIDFVVASTGASFED